IAITGDNVSDEAGLYAVLAGEATVAGVIAAGAYYSIAQTEAWSTCSVLPVIPPPPMRSFTISRRRAGTTISFGTS
ncbi:hypothetical protein, partial [Paraburkholderia sp. BR14427]|uniref:hypothetical protein n=1 Tax=Paraburkholderia sp. BR14427 TaxID=3237008 RepID=UPI0034CF1551